MARMLVWLGLRSWRDIDGDGPFTLQECKWTGEQRTVVKGRNVRKLYPRLKPRWKS